MSAIAGMVRFTGPPVDRGCLERAGERLAAPGVGAAAVWCDGRAGLVARQRISTPEDRAERQPWVGGGGRLALVYDGRLDNRDEIAAALGLTLDPTEVIPDGALLLRALERWGEAALPRLLGEFALALWDASERRLLLARDQLGQRTLYSHHGDGFVAFATTLSALLALPGVPRRLNEEALADFLVLNFLFSEETLYAGIRRVPPATAVSIDAGRVRQSRYWAFDPDRRICLPSDDHYAEAAREQLDRAVARRLRSAGPVVASMSGGLDSSAVATSAARQLAPGRLLALTLVPPPDAVPPPVTRGWYGDETPYVTAIARMHPNMDLRRVWSRGEHWIESDPTRLFEAGGTPIYGPTNAAWFAPLSETAGEFGSTVMLNGQAGNAAWSWDGLSYLGELFRRGRWVRLLRELNATAPHRNYSRSWLLRQYILKPMMPPWLDRIMIRLLRGQPERWSRFSGINPDFARDVGAYRRCLEASHGPASPGAWDPWQERVNRFSTYVGSDGRAAWRAVDGIERRDPLSDLRLVEFCLAVPAPQYLRGGITRRLARRALADRLPAEAIDKDVMGMQNPEWFGRLAARRSRMVAEVAELQRSPLAARCLDLPRISTLLRDWPEDAAAAAAREAAYHYLLPRALHVGRFLLWLESGAG